MPFAPRLVNESPTLQASNHPARVSASAHRIHTRPCVQDYSGQVYASLQVYSQGGCSFTLDRSAKIRTWYSIEPSRTRTLSSSARDGAGRPASASADKATSAQTALQRSAVRHTAGHSSHPRWLARSQRKNIKGEACTKSISWAHANVPPRAELVLDLPSLSALRFFLFFLMVGDPTL